ncbi:PHD finger protein 20-like isoform X2 [Ornithodoros turicata]|uniref:PHD finger protein 20-like isoform X2 n=1 Tax=Ornithodoros turicata TaxID=34597 RepID=UPI00313A0071
MSETGDFVISAPSIGEEDSDIIDAELVLPAPESDYGSVQSEDKRLYEVEETENNANEDLDEGDSNHARSDKRDEPTREGVAETADSIEDDRDIENTRGYCDAKKDDDGEEPRRPSCGGTSSGKSDPDTDSVSSSVSKRKRGVPIFSPGTRVEAQDFQEKWYPAKVVTVDEEDGDVLIHFEGWSSRYDEWVSMDSPRLRYAPQQSTRKRLNLKSTKKAYKEGEEVLARWADGRKYPAKILEVNADESYMVLFYDGFEKRVKGINIEKMPRDKKGSVTFPKLPQKDTPTKEEAKKTSKEPQTEPKKAPSLVDVQKADSKKVHPHQEKGNSSMRSKDQKSGLKPDGTGKKADKRDGSVSSSSSSSSHSKKKILLVGGKFMAKREDSQEVPLSVRKKSEKKEGVKRKRGFSASDGVNLKRERKSSVTKRDSSGQSSASSSMPSTPAEYSCGFSDNFSHNGDSSATPQFTPDGRRIAPKEFIIEEDHNHFKCTFEGCNKSFRKEPLLQSHLKHYHGSTSPGTATTPSKRRSTDMTLGHASSTPPEKVQTHASTQLQAKEAVQHPAENASKQEADVTVKSESVLSNAEGISEEAAVQNVTEEMTSVAEHLLPSLEQTAAAPVTESTGDTVTAVEPIVLAETSTSAAAAAVADVVACPPVDTLVSAPLPPSVGTASTPVVQKAPRRMRFVPHYESLAKGREKRKIAKTEKALIADMEAAASRRGAHGERKRKRTSSTRSDKSEDGQVKQTTSKESRKLKLSETGTFPSNGDAAEAHSSHPPHHRGKRKRHSLPSVSESQSSHCSVKDHPEPGHMKTIDPVDISSDEIVRCICNCEEESGLMMQCEVCLTWQHGACFSIEEEKDVPDKYVCYSCLNPRARRSQSGNETSSIAKNKQPKMQETKESYSGVRESFRYKHDQDWFTRGEMATFAFLKDNVLPNPRPEPVKATHNLMASMHNVFSALRGMTHKINIASAENHPDLKHFALPWGEGGYAKGNVCGKPSEMTAGEMTDFSRPGRDILVSPFDHTYFGQPECSNGVQEAPDVVVTSLEEPPEEILVQDADGLEVGCVEEVTEPKSEGMLEIDVIAGEEEVVAVADDDEDDDASTSQVLEVPGMEAGPIQEAVQEHVVVPPPADIGNKIDPEVCKKNLLNHIFSMQDQLDLKLTSMEEKLQALENESNAGNNNQSLSEEEEVLKLRLSLKGLMKDLNAVHRLSMFH